MAELTLLEKNEYAEMPAEKVAALAIEAIDTAALEGARALALAIVLSDRLEASEGPAADPTAVLLAGMLVEELAPEHGHHIKQCLSALLAKCQSNANEEAVVDGVGEPA